MANNNENKVRSSEIEIKDRLVAINRVTKVTEGRSSKSQTYMRYEDK